MSAPYKSRQPSRHPERLQYIFSQFRGLSQPLSTAMKSFAISSLLIAGLMATASAAEPPQCKVQKVENVSFEMCMQPGASFQHDIYTLKADKVLLFALVDDFAEKIELEHTIPPGVTIEFPLSKQGTPTVKISGGCVPESKDGAEIARLCNFSWGKYHVIKDVRFEFK